MPATPYLFASKSEALMGSYLNRILTPVEDADIFARAVAMLIERHDDEARNTLRTLPKDDPIPSPKFSVSLAVPPVQLLAKKTLSMTVKARVYDRDGWRCRYCNRKLVVPGILSLLTSVSPGFKGLLPGHHMPYDLTKPAVERAYPNVDHILAVANGGAWLDDGNHATACTKCNAKKSNWLGWVPGPINRDDWDGLQSMYRPLADRYYADVARVRKYHSEWFAALGV